VLVVPRAKPLREFGRKVLVAWDGSREAAVALRDALPLLSKAASVAIVSLHAGAAPQDVGDLLIPQALAWLQRHGIQANATQHPAARGFAAALLSRAAQDEAGLIVMGGYGHTRIREWVLGGVTRAVLERMDVPILMAH
jgi:nucleotide-binding universal stress UspA family protein